MVPVGTKAAVAGAHGYRGRFCGCRGGGRLPRMFSVGACLCFGFVFAARHHKKEETKREGTLGTKKFMEIKLAITKLATNERFGATKLSHPSFQ